MHKDANTDSTSNYSNYSLHVYRLNFKISLLLRLSCFKIKSIEIPRPMKPRSINVACNEIDCCRIKNSFWIQASGKSLTITVFRAMIV